MGIASFFKVRREDKFIQLLIEQSEITTRGLAMLLEFVHDPSEENIKAMREQEYAADEVRRILIDELHNTFVTPLDREDIFNISLNVDEMLDYAYSTLEGMRLLKVDADEYLVQMLEYNHNAANELWMSMQRLRNNPRVAGEHAQRTRKLENEVDRLYRVAIADLFTKAKDFKQMMSLLRRREIYRHVSNMADRAAAAADVVGMVVMKLT
ncbi:MAG: DUF47 family protein [Anaerolineae bacterium]|nr:MAG: DUF47 family protein [Anaerolineae bacterium]